jgi:hypothetical protein
MGPEPEPHGSVSASETCAPKTFRMNRNSVLKKYLLSLGWREALPKERAQLAHWDPVKAGPPNAACECWPRSTTNSLDNIWTYFERIIDAGYAEHFPKTYFEWRKLDRRTIDASPVWFLKGIWGTHGKGITLIGSYAEYVECIKERPQKAQYLIGPDGKRQEIPDAWYVQPGICDVHLVEDRKYILRCWFLTLGTGNVFVFNDALGYGHKDKFDPSDKSWAVHCSHLDEPGKPRVTKDERFYFVLSDYEHYGRVMDDIYKRARIHSRVFQDAIQQSQGNPDVTKRVGANNYHVWGVDVLVRADFSTTVIEGKATVPVICLRALFETLPFVAAQ